MTAPRLSAHRTAGESRRCHGRPMCDTGGHTSLRARHQAGSTLAAFALAALTALTGLGCEGDAPAPPPARLAGTLSFEVRDSADVVLELAADGRSLRVTLETTASHGLLPAGSPLVADGRVAAFPEASGVLYTAKLQGPAQPDGPCGAEPVSLALSLHRSLDDAMVLGGMAAYCGHDRYDGVPVRILRLAGELGP